MPSEATMLTSLNAQVITLIFLCVVFFSYSAWDWTSFLVRCSGSFAKWFLLGTFPAQAHVFLISGSFQEHREAQLMSVEHFRVAQHRMMYVQRGCISLFALQLVVHLPGCLPPRSSIRVSSRTEFWCFDQGCGESCGYWIPLSQLPRPTPWRGFPCTTSSGLAATP